MRNKWLKALIVTVTVVPWSVVIVLLLQVKSIVSQQPKVETVPVIEVADTIINEQPKSSLRPLRRVWRRLCLIMV